MKLYKLWHKLFGWDYVIAEVFSDVSTIHPKVYRVYLDLNNKPYLVAKEYDGWRRVFILKKDGTLNRLNRNSSGKDGKFKPLTFSFINLAEVQ